MAQFTSIIAQIAAALSITSLDVYVFFGVFVFVLVIAAFWLAHIYSTLFGIVLGMGIFVLFSTILSPEFQTPETLSLISQTFAKLLIGSSVYLIFILAILVPLNGGILVTLPKTPLAKIFQTLVLSIGLIAFIVAIALGLIEKSYIFVHTDSAFTLIKKTLWYSDIRSAEFIRFVNLHLPTIIILSIGFAIYKLLLADIVNALIVSLIANMKKQRSLSNAHMSHAGGHGDHGGHEEAHDDHWWGHDDHGWHDDHGGHEEEHEDHWHGGGHGGWHGHH